EFRRVLFRSNLIKTYVRAGLGAGLLAEMAVGPREDQDLRILPAPAEIPECITWAVIPRGRVLREYALHLLHLVAPQIDRRDLRRVLEGNLEADWPAAPGWQDLSQPITFWARSRRAPAARGARGRAITPRRRRCRRRY